ncbi:baseplate assembly protein [Rhizobiales bacterium RZME27]|uniref:Baseplate assembly protein n=1 Tax=Endobacterium cereale TaxID=2663029 RepID=A0A6A8A1L9_9HYPH|nr:GPW/gp25 family protein [Endobacterium cereale]MQY44503.1 baseplate assembly protein [Endobacterium cereale]
MSDSAGASAETGQLLTNWEHVQQSIRKILTTRLNTRVMRRDFGSELPDLIDAKMIGRNVLAVYSAAATAIKRWEPRYRVRVARVTNLTAGGQVTLELFGLYYPRGHLNDYSIVEDASTRIIFEV